MNETLIKMTELLDRIRHETGADEVEARNSHMDDLVIRVRWGDISYRYAYPATELMSAKLDLTDDFVRQAKRVKQLHFEVGVD